jgi:hypothetical protein
VGGGPPRGLLSRLLPLVFLGVRPGAGSGAEEEWPRPCLEDAGGRIRGGRIAGDGTPAGSLTLREVRLASPPLEGRKLAICKLHVRAVGYLSFSKGSEHARNKARPTAEGVLRRPFKRPTYEKPRPTGAWGGVVHLPPSAVLSHKPEREGDAGD